MVRYIVEEALEMICDEFDSRGELVIEDLSFPLPHLMMTKGSHHHRHHHCCIYHHHYHCLLHYLHRLVKITEPSSQ